MRFVPVKSTERRAALVDHKSREFLVRQRTQVVSAIRAHLVEFGIVVAEGIHITDRLLVMVEKATETARPVLGLRTDQFPDAHDRILAVTARMEAAQSEDPLARRLATVPGIGAITASALAAMTPVSPSSGAGGTTPPGWASRPRRAPLAGRSGAISKAGNRSLRRLLYLGAMSRIRARRSKEEPGSDWLGRMLERKPVKRVAIPRRRRG